MPMKTPLLMPDNNIVNEIKRITGLICDLIDPAFVILFGEYADMKFQNAVGGYELLVLTTKPATVPTTGVNIYINEQFPIEERIEKRLVIHIRSLERANNERHYNYFYYIIRNEGILLYNCGLYKLWTKNKFDFEKALENVRHDSETFITLGESFYKDARSYLTAKAYRAAAVNIYNAACELFFTVARIHYGYAISENHKPMIAYNLARHVSKALFTLWNTKESSYIYSFDHLRNLNRQARFENKLNVEPELLTWHLEQMKQLIAAAKATCKQRVDILSELYLRR